MKCVHEAPPGAKRVWNCVRCGVCVLRIDGERTEIPCCDRAKEVARLQAVQEQLVAALEAHSMHALLCFAFTGSGGTCSCGLDAALAAAKGGAK